jgi:hypothetical protein
MASLQFSVLYISYNKRNKTIYLFQYYLLKAEFLFLK